MSFSKDKRSGYRIGNPNRIRHKGRRKGVHGSGCGLLLLVLVGLAGVGLAAGYALALALIS
jgi:hypothetical protein